MQETTDIYLLDHPSGYEWRYQLGDLLQEFYEEVSALVPEGPAMSELTMERALELRADRIDYITLRVLDNGKALLRHVRDVFRPVAEV
jgi:hypothetical protein